MTASLPAIGWDDRHDEGAWSLASVEGAGPYDDTFDLDVSPIWVGSSLTGWRWRVWRNGLKWGEGREAFRANAKRKAAQRVRFCVAFLDRDASPETIMGVLS